MTVHVSAVIGACFGDEGKGAVTDWLSAGGTSQRNGAFGPETGAPSVLVVRHNGGAQSGHTVVCGGRRFVFHELSAGSFRGAATLWADSFRPDLYKLGEEAADFRNAAGFLPRIYAEAAAQVTLIDDVLINMAAETCRGDERHGSCGMGIYESQLRSEAGFGIPIGTLAGGSAAALYRKMRRIRREYVPLRLEELQMTASLPGEYGELLSADQVLYNAAETMMRNLELVELMNPSGQCPDAGSFGAWDQVIFETGQGLLLDERLSAYTPHVTASRTGLYHPAAFCQRHGLRLDQVFYVTRAYVTRHGAGPLPAACEPEVLGKIRPDVTNQPNPWQGRLRYARHASPEDLARRLKADIETAADFDAGIRSTTGNGAGSGSAAQAGPLAALVVTHLDETGGQIRFAGEDIKAAALTGHPAFSGWLSAVYGSEAPGEIREVK